MFNSTLQVTDVYCRPILWVAERQWSVETPGAFELIHVTLCFEIAMLDETFPFLAHLRPLHRSLKVEGCHSSPSHQCHMCVTDATVDSKRDAFDHRHRYQCATIACNGCANLQYAVCDLRITITADAVGDNWVIAARLRMARSCCAGPL